MINANLLPPEIKDEIAQSKQNAKGVKFIWLTLFFLLVALLMTAGIYFYSSQLLTSVNTDLKNRETATEKYGTLELKAKKLAARLLNIKQINAKKNTWSGVISEIQAVMPSGVYLNSVKIDSSATIRNQVAGSAKSKQEVASLRDAMEKSDKFEYVDIESSTTTAGQSGSKDVESFVISFSLSKGALK